MALSNDVIKIDGRFGTFIVKKQIRISKPTNITFTSYNGVPWIYGEGASWRILNENPFLAFQGFQSSTPSVVTINEINFRDTALANIGIYKSPFIMTVHLNITNCRFQLFDIKKEKRSKPVFWVTQALITMNSPFTKITFENCVINANYRTGIIRHPVGVGCRCLSSTVIAFRNTTIEDARYSVFAWSPECTNMLTKRGLKLYVINCMIKSRRQTPSRKTQFAIATGKFYKHTKWIEIRMENSRFEDLSVETRTAAVMDIRGPSTVKITQCTFKGNIGNRGGAVSFHLCTIHIKRSHFEDNKVKVSTSCSYKDQGGSGGAIFVSGVGGRMRMTIFGSTFINNMADCFGSAVYLGHFTRLTVIFTRISSILSKRNSTGSLWYSSSSRLKFNEVSFEAKERTMADGVLFYARSNKFEIGERKPYFKCPKGSTPNISITHEKKPKGIIKKVSCQYCPKHSYTLRPSYAIGLNETKSKQAQQQQRQLQQCHQCVFGAVCKRGIKSKPNFWGYVNKGKAFMLVCPPGYCCQTKDKCVALQSCNGMRTGRLCGKCKNGYFQSFFTSECLHEKFCKTGKFWALAVCFCVLFTILFIFLQDIFTIIVKSLCLEKVLSVSKRLFFWLMGKFPCMKKVNERSGDDKGTDVESITNESLDNAEESVDESAKVQSNECKIDTHSNSIACGLIKIVFLFYQIHSLLMVYKSHRENKNIHNVKQVIHSVFNLDIQIPLDNELHCPSLGMDSTTKVLIKALFPINCLIFATFLYILVHALALCFKSNETIQMYSMKAKPRLLIAILQLILLGYSILISSTLSLVTCLPLVTGQKILYIDGSVSCYQHWQYAILTFIIVWAIPLIYALHKLPIYMRNGEISIRGFYIALLLPLPFAVYAIIRGAREIKCSNANNIQTDTLTLTPSFISNGTDVKMMQLLNVVEGPFRFNSSSSSSSSSNKRRKLSWEPVLLLQRLLLSLCHTFVLEPTNRSLVLLLSVIVLWKVNVLRRPFNSSILNAINGMIFILLCTTGIINLIYTFFYEYVSVPKGPIVQLFIIFDYVEVIMVMIFPLIAVVTFVLLAVAKLTVFVSNIVGIIAGKCNRCHN